MFSSTSEPSKLGSATKVFFDTLIVTNVDIKTAFNSMSIEEYRASILNFFNENCEKFSLDNEIEMQNKVIPRKDGSLIQIKLYCKKSVDSLLPGVLFIPGGGCIVDLGDVYDSPCSKIADISGAVVIKISPRLAPEFNHQEILEDVYDAVKYIYDNAISFGIDQKRFIMSGYSSGGNFAALITNKAKRLQDIRFVFQVLISPRVDASITAGGTDTFREFEDVDIMLPKEVSKYYASLYIPKGMDARDYRLSPYYDDLHELPPTFLWVGEFDGARGDSEIYYQKLKQSGVVVRKTVGAGQTHSNLICRKVLSDGLDPANIVGQEIKEYLSLGSKL